MGDGDRLAFPVAMVAYNVGIPSPITLALSVYLASVHAAMPLTARILGATPFNHVAEACASWLETSKAEPPSNPARQKQWIQPIADRQWGQLISDTDSVSVSRLHGCRAPGAGDWFNALPSGTLGLRLNDEQFSTAIALRLGAPVCSAHTCVCGAKVEQTAQHTFVCNKMKSRHARHRLGNETILHALKSAEAPATLEPLGLSRSDGKRPDGATLLAWKGGKPLVWDFTCVHRLAARYSDKARQEGATIATAAEGRKRDKYRELSPHCVFQPVAVETLGGLGHDTLDFLRELGSRIGSVNGDKRAPLFLRQRLAVAVQMGNAAYVRESCDRAV